MSNSETENGAYLARMRLDTGLQRQAHELFLKSCEYRYSYNFSWLGRPVIQYPQDLMAMQEIIWRVKPDLIIETGVAHGGSLVFYASLLQLLDNAGEVLGIDIEIRSQNRRALEDHPMFRRIHLMEGSSTDPKILGNVKRLADGKRVIVVLDSNHTHDHVFAELNAYSPLVQCGGYLVVFDTVVADMPKAFFPDRPWGPSDNPKTAVHQFLGTNDRFVIDKEIETKLLLTVAPDGYLLCVKDL